MMTSTRRRHRRFSAGNECIQTFAKTFSLSHSCSLISVSLNELTILYSQFLSPFNNSFASVSYACAPTDVGAYSEIGNPYEGASARRTLRGMMLLNTKFGK